VFFFFFKEWLVTVKSPGIEMDLKMQIFVQNTKLHASSVWGFFSDFDGMLANNVLWCYLWGVDNTDAVILYLIWTWYYSSPNRRWED